ncbi:MAG: site-2 protease family protein [Candidatus Aenigmarchaeota archaeon]|nr:site-2 protease family protein [Candidatus Aenigmarchaeota archaeon]
MERKEAQGIMVSATALAVAFALADSGGLSGISGLSFYAIGLFFVSVSSGFVLHELCHRFIARAYGAYAEYRMWNTGITVALALSLFGVIFAAPGAVYIQPRADIWGRTKNISRTENGVISVAGPVSNVLIALAFFLLGGYLGDVAAIGTGVNLQLAMFNMIPFPPLDGSKVFAWDAKFWGACFLLILAATVVL